MKPKAIFALPMDAQLHRDVKQAAKETGLSLAAVLRNAVRLGLPKFVEGFPKPEAPALPAGK